MSGEDTSAVAPAWDTVHGLKSTDIAAQARSLSETLQTIKLLSEEADALKASILQALTAAKVTDAVMVDDIRVKFCAGNKASSKLDTDKLLKLGVALSVITAATVPGKQGNPYVKLTRREEAE